MKTWVYANRNLKELISDPLSLIFTLGLPIFLVVFMTSLNQRLGFNDAFLPENFVPATIVFSYAFLTMFSGMLVAKDRASSFLSRMYVSPLKSHHYIMGYMIPMMLIATVQLFILYLTGFILGLEISVHIIVSIPVLMFISVLFISLGILIGSVFKDAQVGPVASILIQGVAFLSGMWFNLEMIGGVFKRIGYFLPFAHAVDLTRKIVSGTYRQLTVHGFVLFVYIFLALMLAIVLFKRNMHD